jgi:hypothetical protein
MIMNRFGSGERWILSISMVLIVAIFAVDASTPSGYSACFLYLLPVFICLGVSNDRTIYVVALIATALTIIAVPFEPSGTLAIDLFNRPITIAGIWIVVTLGIQRRKYERDIERKAGELARSNKELEQLTFMISLKELVPLFKTKGALSPETAMTSKDLGLPPGFEEGMKKRLGQSGIFVEINGMYYLSEQRLAEMETKMEERQQHAA